MAATGPARTHPIFLIRQGLLRRRRGRSSKSSSNNDSDGSACTIDPPDDSTSSRCRQTDLLLAKPDANAILKSAVNVAAVAATPPPQKSVRFSTLEIRTYPITLGDNPSVSSGPPITLDWNPTSTQSFTVAAYESHRPPSSRRQSCELLLPQSLRIELLTDDAHVNIRAIVEACQEVAKCKRQRRRTVDALERPWWQCRAIRKVVPTGC
jgi:hypothetical protein